MKMEGRKERTRFNASSHAFLSSDTFALFTLIASLSSSNITMLGGDAGAEGDWDWDRDGELDFLVVVLIVVVVGGAPPLAALRVRAIGICMFWEPTSARGSRNEVPLPATWRNTVGTNDPQVAVPDRTQSIGISCKIHYYYSGD